MNTQFPTFAKINGSDMPCIGFFATVIALFTWFFIVGITPATTAPYAVPACHSVTINTSYATRHDEVTTFTTAGTITVWDGATASLVTTPCMLRVSNSAVKLYADGHVYTGHTSVMSSDSGWYEIDEINLVK